MSVKIFVNYRRDDSGPTAGRLREKLLREFGGKNVFMDVDSIPVGVDFEKRLQDTLDQSAIVLSLIGRNWLNVSNANGRRLDDPSDYVRTELTRAFAQSKTVIPVLVDGAGMPTERELPSSLQALSKRNAFELRNANFEWDAKRLMVELFRSLNVRPRLARLMRWCAAAAFALVGALAYFAVDRGWFGLTPYSMWTPSGFMAADFRVRADQDPPPCDIGNSAPTGPVPIYWRGEANLALLNQAVATASSVIPGFETRHQIDFLNDGWYNNCRSWIPAAMPAWAQIDLGDIFEIRRVVLGSEHTKHWGDRRLLKFRISVRQEQDQPWNATVSHDEGAWPVDTTTAFEFPTRTARFVRVDLFATVNNDLPRIDEIEVYGHKIVKSSQ
jgi:hypothetical protein